MLKADRAFVITDDTLFEKLKIHLREIPDLSGTLLPVMHCINWSSPPLHDALRGRAILSDTPGYKPPQFGDEGRDAQVKIARTVACARSSLTS